MHHWILLCLMLTAPLVSHAGRIDTSYAVSIGGIRQWISIRATERANPILLYLHGGPGNSSMRYANRFTNLLQKHFTVVLWEQRDCGKTWEMNHSLEPLTLKQAENDALELMNYLCTRFKRDKIFIVGHSWGGFIALRLAGLNPDRLQACVAASPMVNQLESERISLDTMMAITKRARNNQAQQELGKVRIPFESADQLYYHRKWAYVLSGGRSFTREFVLKWSEHWLPLFLEGSAVNLEKELPEIRCPVYFFVGKKDLSTNPAVTVRYYKALRAQKKDLIWFTNSGHSLNLTEAGKFQQCIIALLNQ